MPETRPSLILLDTHVWIWLLTGDPRLSSSSGLAAIEKASRQSNLRVSAISIWEVGMLEAKNRIRFSTTCLDWIRQALSAPGISLAPLLPEIAVESTRLPGKFHGDPADCILVATARHVGARLVTHDRNILSYGREGHVKVVAV